VVVRGGVTDWIYLFDAEVSIMSQHRSWSTRTMSSMIQMVLNQQLVALKRWYPNLERTIQLLEETVKSF
jgi:hypothetical protein